ncbi:ABC transporter substrate-binding protein, partial [Enterococcus hirae]
QALELVYDTLFELDAELNVQPGLAEEWSYSDDGTMLTITLRDDVTFHGGDTFDSEDAKATLERILDEETGAVARANLLSVESVEAPDA